MNIASPSSADNKKTRRKKISRVLSKVRFRELETCSDDENEVLQTRSETGCSSSSWKGRIVQSPQTTPTGNSLACRSTTYPSKLRESKKKHLGSEDRVRCEATPKRHSIYSPARRVSGRISLGLLPPTLQSVREMSYSTRNTREIEPPHDRRKSLDIMRSHSERYAKESRRLSIRDEAGVQSWGIPKGRRASDGASSPKGERGAIEAIFRTTSTFSNSEADSISLKGFFQNLIALENETL
ncbi:hypothetical protein FGB62_1g427 [Gracilaria domingensis]|nr:hypothetical protein FGB62_1g427 [Gracilaria domingensis]